LIHKQAKLCKGLRLGASDVLASFEGEREVVLCERWALQPRKRLWFGSLGSSECCTKADFAALAESV
tara:strand:+ start:125900 stop:126100 length:201 start_codon:yes stop_codon:yes gene_type:complete